MSTIYEHEIRERAYAIWMEAGMVDGDAERHWLRAETALRDETETPRAAPRRGGTASARKPVEATSAKVVGKSSGTSSVKTPARTPSKISSKISSPAKTAAKPEKRRAKPASDATLGAGA